MANVVTNLITVENCNEELFNFLESFFKFDKDDKIDFGLIKKLFDDAPEDLNYGWMDDNCGSKWIVFVSANQLGNNYEVILESAWTAPVGWFQKFADKLQTIQPDIIVYDKYTDEAYNSAGILFIAKGFVEHLEEDMEEWDIDRLNDGDEEYMEEFYGVMLNNLTQLKEDYEDSLNTEE